MARRSILSTTDCASLMALPESQDDLIRYYTLNETDLSLIRQRRGASNRLGFAVQLCLLRFPGYALASDVEVTASVLMWIAQQIQADASEWHRYGNREETRREHALEIRGYFGPSPFGLTDFRILVRNLTDIAMQTDKGLVLAEHALELLRQRQVILPVLSVIERACAEALTHANRKIYRRLTEQLTQDHYKRLDDLLTVKPDSNVTWLG